MRVQLFLCTNELESISLCFISALEHFQSVNIHYLLQKRDSLNFDKVQFSLIAV